jgi:fumarate hydratase class II
MPGKVNPVIPEAVLMAATQVIGNDLTVSMAGQSGNFQLNVMLPLIASNLIKNIYLLANSCDSLSNKVMPLFTINNQTLNSVLNKNPILVTALNSRIGYSQAAAIAKKAYQDNENIIDVAEKMTDIPRAELEVLLDPAHLIKNKK